MIVSTTSPSSRTTWIVRAPFIESHPGDEDENEAQAEEQRTHLVEVPVVDLDSPDEQADRADYDREDEPMGSGEVRWAGFRHRHLIIFDPVHQAG
jgi:hypothetical protein